MKSITAAAFLIALPCMVSAQGDRSAFTETGRGAVTVFAEDYQSLGINPANLAWGNPYGRRVTFGMVQTGVSLYSQAFTRANLNSAIREVDTELTPYQKLKAGSDLAGNNLTLNADILLFGIAVNTGMAGNFAFSIDFSNSFYANFNAAASSQLFTGYLDPYFDQWEIENPDGTTSVIPNGGANSEYLDQVVLGFSTNPKRGSELYDGSEARALSTMRYSFGYAYTAFETTDLKFSAGAGLTYMQGLYLLDARVENGAITAYTASTPALDIDYGSGMQSNPSAIEGTALKPVGSGFGFDLGLNLEFKQKFRLGMAIVDIGSLVFDGNLYTATDTVVYDTESLGIDSYNVFGNFDAFLGDDGLFQWEGEEERKVNLPTQVHLGFGYFPSDWLHLGMDVSVPMNQKPGNPDAMFVAAGFDVIPVSAIRISAGAASGADYGFRVPFGLNFVLGNGGWEFGVATRDVLYAFRQDRPNMSAAFGFLRFRVGDDSVGSQSQIL